MRRKPKQLDAAELMERWERDHPIEGALEEDALEFDAAELSEFLSGDLIPPSASAEFRERLRDRLWTMVEARYGTPHTRGSGSGGRGGTA